MFEEACTHPAALALAEYICGRGCTLSSVLATVRTAGSRSGCTATRPMSLRLSPSTW